MNMWKSKKLAIALIIIWLILVGNAYAATRYSSPSGSGSTCSDSVPCSLTTGLSQTVAEDTLYLKDGIYSSSLDVPNSGTSGAYITIKALNDGQATINASGIIYGQCDIDGKSYINLEGIICRNAQEVVRVKDSDHINIRRVSVYQATDQHFLSQGSDYVLFEDCFVKATSESVVNILGGSHVTVRRMAVVLENYTSGGFGAITDYGAPDCLFENNIVTSHPGRTSTYVGMRIWVNYYSNPVNDSRFYGNVVYGISGEGFRVDSNNKLIQNNEFINNAAVDTDNDGFSQRADTNLLVDHLLVVSNPDIGFNQNQDSVTKDSDWDMDGTVKNSIFLSGSVGILKDNTDPAYTSLTSKYNTFSGITTQYSGTVLDKTGDNTTTPNYNTSTYGKGAYLIKPSNLATSGEGGTYRGAEVLYEYVDGVLTSTPLWPWPMEARICEETGYSVTYTSAYPGCVNGGGIWLTLNNVYATEESPATYFINPTLGSDTNNGTTEAAPWQTLAKINSVGLVAGDIYYLKRGETWNEFLTVHDSGTSNNRILFGTYGSGNRPIINARSTVTGWTATGGSSGQLTIQPTDGVDTYFKQSTPTTNWGTNSELHTNNRSSYRQRSILSSDFSALDNAATITNAVFSLYYYEWETSYSDPTGIQVDVDRMTRTNWTETGATWNCARDDNYDGTCDVNWTAYGGDYTETNKATTTIPASFGWVNWNVTSIAQYAQANTSEILYALVKYATESDSVSHIPHFYSSDNTVNEAYNPKLVIDYTTGAGGNIYKLTSVTTAPTRMWFDTATGDHKTDGDGCLASLVNDLDWCYKTSASELYIYSATAPSGRTIERDYPYGIDFNGKSYITVQNIEVKNAGTANVRMNGNNGILEKSNIHDALLDGVLSSGTSNEIRYNLIYDNLGDGIEVSAGTVNIYNDVLNANNIGWYAHGTSTFSIINTLSTNSTTSHTKVTDNPSISIHHNDYYPDTGTKFHWKGTDYDFAGWKSHCDGCDANSYAVDPMYVNATAKNFHLLQGSGIIDKGYNLNLVSDYDSQGLWIGSAPDIGAFEMFLSQWVNSLFLFGGMW